MSQPTPQGQPSSSSGQGELFGRYRLRGILGQGGMGRLYVAEQVGIEGFTKIVALKRILPHLAASPHFRAMFLNEARVAARLEHPNIVATFELGEVDGNYFISMEYLSGEDLASVLTRCQTVGPLPVEIAAALAQQSANGLHYAHEMRDPTGKAVELVHRDVSPLNIFVTYYGMVKLLDFGIVKDATDPAKTSPGVFKGKYAYCAPEQLTGGQITRQTDIFCLGIVLWESLTGRRLFLRDTDALTIDAVRGHQVEPPSVFRKDVPTELDQIVLQALSRERIVRFGTAHAFSEALDHFLAKRGNRPTSKSIGLWMESIFGSQRATLKKAIAQGRDVETALNLLPTIGVDRSTTTESLGGPPSVSSAQPRLLWSSKVSGIHGPDPRGPTFAGAPPPGSIGSGLRRGGDSLRADGDSLRGSAMVGVAPVAAAPAAAPAVLDFSVAAAARQPADARGPSAPGRTGLLVGAALALGLAVVGLLVVTRSRPTAEHLAPTVAAAVTTTASLELKTEPPGAQILVDGDPSGLTTPAVLKGLRAGRAIEVRLDRVGFRPITEKIELKAGEAGSRSFQLVESTGTVAVEGFPPHAIIYLDDNLVEGHGPLSVSTGEHRIRIETPAGVLLSETLNVVTGLQTVRPMAQRKGVKPR